MDSYYNIGQVVKVTIESDNGSIVIEDAFVEISIEQEMIGYYTREGGLHKARAVISETKKVSIKTIGGIRAVEREELERMIRDD